MHAIGGSGNQSKKTGDLNGENDEESDKAEHCNNFVNTLMSCALGPLGHVTFCTTLRLSAASLWKSVYTHIGEIKSVYKPLLCFEHRNQRKIVEKPFFISIII